MKYLFFLPNLICCILCVSSCTSDNVVDLGDGYYYRDEGGDIKDIYCEIPKGGEIPATVLLYSNDKRFIVAKQKPKLPQDPLYDNQYNYKYGDDQIYYWIIIKKNKMVIGPMNKTEYQNERYLKQIPGDVEIE